MGTDATKCVVCGGEFSVKRTIIDGNSYHPSCALQSHGSHTSRDMASVVNKLWRLYETSKAFDACLSSDCDGPERDALRAAIAETYS